MVNVMRAMGGLMLVSTRVALPIRCNNRWPAVMLAVNRTAKAKG